MNDGIETLDAKQYFEELQRVLVSLPKDGLTKLLIPSWELITPAGRCSCVEMEEAPRSHPTLLVILEGQLIVMVGRDSASSHLLTICQP